MLRISLQILWHYVQRILYILYKRFFILEFGNGGGPEINSLWPQGTTVNPFH